MKLRLVFALAALTIIVWSNEAQAEHQRGSYSVDVLINGAPQQVHMHNGRSFVAGAYGASYQIRVHNRSGRRIEAVVAVDGRNVVNGQPIRPRRHRGYIIPPWGSTTIDGFRSSNATVAAFRFGTIPESYAWRTGTANGIGTIRVWVYEERAPRPVIGIPTLPYGGAAPGRRHAPNASGADAAEAAPSAPQAMGTTYGEQRYSPVAYTSFVRRSRRAQAVLGIRYNSRQMLQAAGIIAPVYPVQPVYCVGCYHREPVFTPPPPQRVYVW